jgi:hypothetical protein
MQCCHWVMKISQQITVTSINSFGVCVCVCVCVCIDVCMCMYICMYIYMHISSSMGLSSLQWFFFTQNLSFAICGIYISRLGGVIVRVLVVGLSVRGFKPDRGDGFLRAIRICRTTSLGEEVKPSAPYRKVLGYLKITCKYEQKYFARPNSYSFRSFLLIATTLLCH